MKKILIIVGLVVLVVGATLLAMNKPETPKDTPNEAISAKAQILVNQSPVAPAEAEEVRVVQEPVSEPPLDPYLVAKGIVRNKYPDSFDAQWLCLDFYLQFYGRWGTAEEVQTQIDFLSARYASFCSGWANVNGLEIHEDQKFYIDIHNSH